MKKGSFAVRLFLYASLVSLIWLGGYVLLSEVFAIREEGLNGPEATPTPMAELPATEAAQWSVLAVAAEDGEIIKFMFRYADFVADTQVFTEVPVTTKVELENGGYEVLKVHNPEMPKLFMVSDLCRIFSEETLCMAAEEVGVSLLGIRPKECYVMEQATFEKLTETKDGQVRFRTPGSVKETISEAIGHSVTNDTLRAESVYRECYADTKNVIYRMLPGENTAETYRPDGVKIRELVQSLQAGVFEEEEG